MSYIRLQRRRGFLSSVDFKNEYFSLLADMSCKLWFPGLWVESGYGDVLPSTRSNLAWHYNALMPTSWLMAATRQPPQFPTTVEGMQYVTLTCITESEICGNFYFYSLCHCIFIDKMYNLKSRILSSVLYLMQKGMIWDNGISQYIFSVAQISLFETFDFVNTPVQTIFLQILLHPRTFWKVIISLYWEIKSNISSLIFRFVQN